MRPKLSTRKKVIARSKNLGHKLKVKSSSKKRFKITATGKILAPQANKRHNMRKRSARQIRNQRGTTVLLVDDKNILKYHNLHLH
jgi:large subunit ribosomal protein L35